MKKTMILFLALTLMLALCACGQSEFVPPSSTPGYVPATAAPAAEEPVAEEPAAEEPAAAETDGEELPLGKITATAKGTRYENAFLGFACELDQNWYVYNEEELGQLAGITADKFKGSSYEELIKNTDVFYDFFASRQDGLATINVNFSYTGPTQGLDIEKYLELMIPQLKSVIESGGMTDVSIEKNTVVFAGAERTGLLIHARTGGTDYYAQQVYFTVGPRISTLTMGTFVVDDTAELVALFKPFG